MIKKVLQIDVGYLEYFRMFSEECCRQVDTTIISKYYTDNKDVKPFFYKYSEKMRNGYYRKIVRFMEYIYGYHKVLKYIKNESFDIVHIHWSLIPLVDCYYFKKIKKYTGKLIYTAHDVIPHSPTEKKIIQLNKVYSIPDRIIVHGQFCMDELIRYYPNCYKKGYIQDFGTPNEVDLEFKYELFEKHQKLKKINSNKNIKVFSFIGQISYYKGLDTLIDSWEVFKDNENVFLLICGATIEDYSGLKEKMNKICNYKNVYIYNQRFTDEEETFFYSLSNIVVLPYRSASMSAVLFSAAKYNKTVLSTQEGCLKEYLRKVPNYKKSNKNIPVVFSCECTTESIGSQLEVIVNDFSKGELEDMGKVFNRHIYNTYSWNRIIKKMIRECYEI